MEQSERQAKRGGSRGVKAKTMRQIIVGARREDQQEDQEVPASRVAICITPCLLTMEHMRYIITCVKLRLIVLQLTS